MANELITPIMLSPESVISLKDMGPNIRTLEKEIAKAERAGIDVTEAKAMFERSKKLRQGLLKEYGS